MPLLLYFLLIGGKFFACAQAAEVDSLKLALANADSQDSADLYTQLGRLHYGDEDFRLALDYFYRALKICETNNDKQGKATLTNNIAAIYYKTDDLSKALEYFTYSLALEQELGNKEGVSKSLNNIAILYNELGQWRQSLQYYDRSLALRDSLNDEDGKATVFNNMGLVYLKQKNYKRAIDHYEKGLKIFQSLGETKSVANTLGNISRAYLFQKDYKSAERFAKESLTYADSAGSSFINLDNYQTLYIIYKETENFEKALFYHEKFESLGDSIKNAKITGQINDIKLRYETERQVKENAVLKSEKEAQAAVIKTQKIVVISILVILGLVSLLAYVWYKNSKMKKESIRLLEEQNRKIESKRRELERLDQVKNKLFSVISHEIRSPLSSLLGTVNLLTSGYLSPEEFFRLSTDLKQKVNHTSNFLNNILVWAKAQMQGINVQKEEFPVDGLINDTLDLLKEQADIKGVELDRHFDDALWAMADKNMIGIVAKNLLSNAIKFTDKGKKVTVKTYRKNDKAVIEVEDHGIGISKDRQTKLFGNESVSTAGTAEEAGTGLGLILSKMLVEENGGSIWLESEEGKGTRFSFTIPLN